MAERILSNGMTRTQNVERLQAYKQGPQERELDCNYVFDIPYGTDSDRQCVDIYTPKTGEGPFPTIIYVHGGGWFAGHRRDGGLNNALLFVEHGYAVAAIGYRLMDETVYPGQKEDLYAGLAKVTELAQEYNLDMSRLGLVGGSAGTSLGLLLALRDKRFKAAVLTSAIMDFTRITEQLQFLHLPRVAKYGYPEQDWSMEALLMGNPIQASAANTKDLTAKLHLTPDMPHIMLFHGTNDNTTPFLQDVEFAQAAVEVTGDYNRVKLVLAPGCGHTIKVEFMSQYRQARVDFMNTYLRDDEVTEASHEETPELM